MRRVGTSLAHLYADDFDDASLLSVDLEPEKTSGTLDAFQQHAPIQCAPLLPLLPHAVRRKPLLSIWTRCREDIADLYRYDLYRYDCTDADLDYDSEGAAATSLVPAAAPMPAAATTLVPAAAPMPALPAERFEMRGRGALVHDTPSPRSSYGSQPQPSGAGAAPGELPG
jgi:hypothetical protein